MPAVDHLTPPLYAQRPKAFSKKSRSTLSWPICWYNRATRLTSSSLFSWSPPKIPTVTSAREVFHLRIWSVWTSQRLASSDILSSLFNASRATLAFNDGLCFLRFYFMSCPLSSFLILGAEPNLNNPSELLGTTSAFRCLQTLGKTSHTFKKASALG